MITTALRRRVVIAAFGAALSMSATLAARLGYAAEEGKTWILDSNNWQEGQKLRPAPVLERVKKVDYW